MTTKQTFNPGDKVRCINAIGKLKLGDIYTVSEMNPDHAKEVTKVAAFLEELTGKKNEKTLSDFISVAEIRDGHNDYSPSRFQLASEPYVLTPEKKVSTEFKKGDKVRWTGEKEDRSFTTGHIYEVAVYPGKYSSVGDDRIDIVSDDDGDRNGHSAKFFELAEAALSVVSETNSDDQEVESEETAFNTRKHPARIAVLKKFEQDTFGGSVQKGEVKISPDAYHATMPAQWDALVAAGQAPKGWTKKKFLAFIQEAYDSSKADMDKTLQAIKELAESMGIKDFSPDEKADPNKNTSLN